MEDAITETGEQARVEINVDAERQAAALAERTRIHEIGKLGRAVNLDGTLVSQHVEAGTPVGDFPKLAEKVAAKIKAECPGVQWRHSWATMGSVDVVDVVESDDVKQVEKAAMLIRAYGHSITETLVATPWNEFIAMLR